MVNNKKNKCENAILTKQIEDFVSYLSVEKNYAENTISSYERDLLKFSSFLNKKGFNDFKEIDSDALNLFIMELRNAGKSGKSLKRYLSSIRVFFTFLMERDGLEINPALTIKTPKIERDLPKTIDFDDLKKMMTIKSSKYTELRSVLMIELLYSCALRVSELVGINLEDIDMNEGFVKVMGKGGKARFSPMGQTTIEVLKRYVKQRPNCNTDALFINQKI